jgi:hypothetical protein
MRAARDSTYPYHSVGRIRTARCRASSLGSSAVSYAPFAPEPRRMYGGYTTSVFNSRPCMRHTFPVFSVRSDADRYREAVPMRGLVQCPPYGAGVVYRSYVWA